MGNEMLRPIDGPAPPASPRTLAFTGAQAGIVLLANDAPRYSVVDINPAFERITGYTAAEWLGQAIQVLQGPSTDELAIARIQKALATGTGAQETIVLYHKAGTPFWSRLRIAPVADEPTGFHGFIVFLRDVTAERWTEDAWEHLDAIVRSSADAIIGTNRNGTITDWNPAAANHFGYTAREATGRPIAEVVASGIAAVELTGMIRAAQEHHRFEGVETLWHTRDGQAIAVALSVSPVSDHAGDVVAIVIIARDITAQKAAETTLRRAKEAADAANQLKDAFLSMVSHELRTPLTSILGYLELLADSLEDRLDADERTFLDTSQASTQRLVNLVNDLLDIAKIEAGGVQLDLRATDLAATIEQVRQMVLPQVLAKGL